MDTETFLCENSLPGLGSPICIIITITTLLLLIIYVLYYLMKNEDVWVIEEMTPSADLVDDDIDDDRNSGKDVYLPYINQLCMIRNREVRLLRQLNERLHKLCAMITARGNTEAKEPADLMPLEMWHYTGELIDDPVSWLNLANTNSVLRLSLESQRVVALLPEVLKIVYKNVDRPSFGRTDVLRCRAVCQRWKNAVNKYIQDPSHRLKLTGKHDTGVSCWPAYWYPSTWIYSFNLNQVEKITEYSLTGQHSTFVRNPVPSRELVIYEMATNIHERPRLRLAITKFLEAFGTQIYFFNFSSFPAQDCLEWYKSLCLWAKLMPNVQRINLIIYRNMDISPSQLVNLNEHVENSPFPNLPNLTVFQCENIPYSIVNSVLIQNSSITKLRIIHFFRNGGSWVLPKAFKGTLTDFFILAYSYSEVMQLEQVSWPLRRLQIETAVSTGIYYARRLFKILNKFKDTITYLKLELCDSPDIFKSFHLPNLTHLCLVFHDHVNIDFLLPLKSLRKLKVEILNDEFDDVEEPNIIEFTHCVDTLHQSNIWDVFPSLKKVTITILSAVTYRFGGKSIFMYLRPNH